MKKIKKTKKTKIVLPPLKINDCDALWYRKKLAILTKKMIVEYTSEIMAYYRLHRSYLVNDANPIAGLQAIIDRIGAKWYRIFEIESEPLAEDVVENAENFSNSQFFEIKKQNPFLLNNPKDLRQTAKIVEASIAENVGLIKSIPVEYHDKILGSVMRAAGSGGNLKQLTDDLSKLTHHTKKRINLIAHDQNAKATALINNQNSIDAGFTHAEWHKSVAGKTHRKSHAEADGKVFELKKGCLIDGEYILPREAINCFPADTLINNTYGINGAFRRWYDGKLTKLITRSGKINKSTPNHPILTLRGWVNANLVNIGDYAINISVGKGFSCNHNGNKNKTTIGDIFDSFGILDAAGIGHSIVARDGNFHGEKVINQNIDIILSNRELMYCVNTRGFIKQTQNLNFSFADTTTSNTSAMMQLRNGVFSSTQCMISFLSDNFSLIDCTISESAKRSLSSVSNLDIVVNKYSSNNGTRNTLLLSNGLFANPLVIGFDNNINRRLIMHILKCMMPGISQNTFNVIFVAIIDFCNFSDGKTLNIGFDQIINSGSIKYSGHVYNLQTKYGFYCANTIVYHNCKCSMSLVINL